MVNTSSGFCTWKTTPFICILDIFHVTVNFSKEWEFCQRKWVLRLICIMTVWLWIYNCITLSPDWFHTYGSLYPNINHQLLGMKTFQSFHPHLVGDASCALQWEATVPGSVSPACLPALPACAAPQRPGDLWPLFRASVKEPSMQPECLPHQLCLENYAENFPAVLNASHQELCFWHKWHPRFHSSLPLNMCIQILEAMFNAKTS